jgi:hypothetical protein
VPNPGRLDVSARLRPARIEAGESGKPGPGKFAFVAFAEDEMTLFLNSAIVIAVMALFVFSLKYLNTVIEAAGRCQ